MKKRIYIFLEYYYPKSQRVSAQLISELADQMTQYENEVFIIVPDPDIKYPYEVKTINDQKVVFFWSPDTKVSNRFLRALSEMILSCTSYICLRKFVKKQPPDYLICLSPTIFYGPYLSFLQKKYKIRNYLILRDIFPQWAVEVGLIKKNGLVHIFFKFFEELNYKSASIIGLEAPSILKQFNHRHPNHSHKTELLFNWVSEISTKHIKKESLREKYQLENKIIFFYGGNIGIAQDVQNIIRLADKMREVENIAFVILGHGTERNKISDLIREKGLEDIIVFAEGVPHETFMDYISEIDIGLITLNKNNKGHNIPGKILNYSRMGIPILGSVNPNNDIIEIINANNAGIVVENGNDEAFKEAATNLLDVSTRAMKSEGSKSLVKKIFNVDKASKKILDKIS